MRTILLDIIRLLLAFIFVLSSIEKLKNPFAFALSVEAYSIFPDLLINFSTLIIPWLELFIAFGLLFNYRLKANLLLYLFLMIIFTILVLIALIKGLNIECGCYGEGSSKIGLTKLMENMVIILGCLLVYLFYFGNKKGTVLDK